MTAETLNVPAISSETEWSVRVPVRGFGDLTAEQYVAERVNTEIEYYNSSASRSKQRYLQMRAITVVGGALVPVMVKRQPALY